MNAGPKYLRSRKFCIQIIRIRETSSKLSPRPINCIPRTIEVESKTAFEKTMPNALFGLLIRTNPFDSDIAGCRLYWSSSNEFDVIPRIKSILQDAWVKDISVRRTKSSDMMKCCHVMHSNFLESFDNFLAVIARWNRSASAGSKMILWSCGIETEICRNPDEGCNISTRWSFVF